MLNLVIIAAVSLSLSRRVWSGPALLWLLAGESGDGEAVPSKRDRGKSGQCPHEKNKNQFRGRDKYLLGHGPVRLHDLTGGGHDGQPDPDRHDGRLQRVLQRHALECSLQLLRQQLRLPERRGVLPPQADGGHGADSLHLWLDLRHIPLRAAGGREPSGEQRRQRPPLRRPQRLASHEPTGRRLLCGG
ncbi:hypothetical protein ACMA1I_23120 [Pontibacter sp. 13R65]|uniref:hypothetical protein n=1 Tax=Pontibacter sp. 13R65 TaxID=3127458 RepID=UPI00301E1904